MARAVVGACAPGTSLALISRETFAVSRLAVANAAVRALGILVKRPTFVGRVDPRKLERAHPLRAVTGKMAQAKAPVVIALANAAWPAGAVTATGIVAFSSHLSQKAQEDEKI